MNAKEMLIRLQRDEDELTTRLDALRQVIPSAVALDTALPLSAASMLEASMQANWQTLSGTLNALTKAEQGIRQRATSTGQNSPEENVIDVQAREVPAISNKPG